MSVKAVVFSDYIYRVAAENEVGVAFSGWSYGRTKEGGKCFVMCKEHNVQKKYNFSSLYHVVVRYVNVDSEGGPCLKQEPVTII